MYIHVHECKYMYGHGTDMSVQIHNHTSHSIMQLHVIVCMCLNIVCTLYIHVWTWYRHVLLKVPPSNSAVPASDNAMVQEFAFWYIQCSDTSIHPKNCSGRW